MAENAVRNPTQDEINQLKKDNSVPSKTKKPTNTPKIEPTSVFEPKAVKFKLPSNKIVIPDGEIFIRRMTTVEESYFQNVIATMIKEDKMNTTAFLSAMNNAIGNCIKSGIDVNDLSLIDKIPVFINMLGLTYGFEHDFDLRCASCGGYFKHKVDLKKIEVKYIPDDYEYPKVIKTTDSFPFEVELTFRYPLVGDEGVFVGENISSFTQYLSMLISASGKLPDGSAITEEHYEDIIRNLSHDDKTQIKIFLNEFSEFGSYTTIKKKVCKEKTCTLYDKIQPVSIPIEAIFLKLF
jgi:hypothetical protein